MLQLLWERRWIINLILQLLRWGIKFDLERELNGQTFMGNASWANMLQTGNESTSVCRGYCEIAIVWFRHCRWLSILPSFLSVQIQSSIEKVIEGPLQLSTAYLFESFLKDFQKNIFTKTSPLMNVKGGSGLNFHLGFQISIYLSNFEFYCPS